jgi:CRISPR-associated protein Cmr4
MSKHASVWLIIPQTNLHVGDESIGNYSIIDKTIQRDATTGLPCINSSSLKGAIKEYLSFGDDLDDKTIKVLFGSSKADKDNSQKGSAIFFDAQILYIPKQTTEGATYKLAWSKANIDAFVQKAENFGVQGIKEKIVRNDAANKETTENQEFQKLCDDDHLPIIARNYLENGESKNLWYEQVLPSMSVLGTIILTDKESDLDILKDKIVQIGANSTIGYGYCKFIKL